MAGQCAQLVGKFFRYNSFHYDSCGGSISYFNNINDIIAYLFPVLLLTTCSIALLDGQSLTAPLLQYQTSLGLISDQPLNSWDAFSMNTAKLHGKASDLLLLFA